MDEAIRTNWVSTVGENINEVEKMTAEIINRKYAVALSAGTAALHLGIKLVSPQTFLRNFKAFGSTGTMSIPWPPTNWGNCLDLAKNKERIA